MTQSGLIEFIIFDVNLDAQSKTIYTPSDSILHPDKYGLPRQESWNYRSVVGKLNFLAQKTQLDISFSVHQCACFCEKPMTVHELAVKQIAHYLLSMKDHGLLLHPTADFKLDMFIDADFAGIYHKNTHHYTIMSSLSFQLHYHLLWLPYSLGQ
jgi:hypothetical protein